MNTFELFKPGQCNRPFPVNEITDTFQFSQYLRLTRDLGEDGGIAKVVVPRTLTSPLLTRILAKSNLNFTYLSAQGGVSLIEDWNAKKLTAPLVTDIEVPDVDKFLSKKTISVGDKEFPASLDQLTIRQLLDIGSAVVELENSQNNFVRLTVKKEDSNPTVRLLQVDDISKFLVNPSIPGDNGSNILVDLNPNEIRQLRKEGNISLKVKESDVIIKLIAKECLPQNSMTLEQRNSTDVPVEAEIRTQPEKLFLSSVNRSSSAFFNLPTSIELVFHLPWQQVWKLLGYSRGLLLNTLSLAPQEETTIEIYTWDRRKNEVERNSTTEAEGNFEQADTIRNTSEVINELNRSGEFTRQADGRINGTYKEVNLNIGGSLNAKDAITNAAKSTLNHLQESTHKATNRIKNSRQTKISETVEIGREDRVTRKIRNANMCHSLNLDYFEVLSNYEVSTEFDASHAGLCALVPNPIEINFNRESLRIYEKPLKRALLDPGLIDGFAAARLLDAWSRSCEIAKHRCSREVADISSDSWSWATAIITPIANALDVLLDKSNAVDLFNMIIFTNSVNWNWGHITSFRYWAYGVALQAAAPSLYNELRNVMIKGLFGPKDFGYEDADRLGWALAIAGGYETISPIKVLAEQLNFINTCIEREFEHFVSMKGRGNPPHTFNSIMNVINALGGLATLDDAGLQMALARFVGFRDMTLNNDAARYKNAADFAAKQDDEATYAVQNAFDLRSLADASERETALLGHLSENVSYYKYALWQSLTPMAQSAYLHSLLPAGLTEPFTIGNIEGNLVFPLIHNYHPQFDIFLGDILEALKEVDVTKDQVTLPTPAVTLESRLGQCNSCEDFIVEQRNLDIALKAADVTIAKERTEQEKLETKRYSQRLTNNPPMLADPDPNQQANSLHITLHQEKNS